MSCVVSISDEIGKQVSGSGFLITPTAVLTCAHVVNSALGLPPASAVRPDRRLKVQIQFAGHRGVPVLASVAQGEDAWSAPPADRAPGADICRLELDNAAPAGAVPGRSVQRLFTTPFNVLASGYPEDWNARVTVPQIDVAEARVLGVDSGLWILRSDSVARSASGISKKRSAGLVYTGFSGGPIQQDGEIVGMIAQVRSRMADGTAYAIPASEFPSQCFGSQPAAVGPAGPQLSILPLRGLNYVNMGSHKYVDNGQFRFSARLNLISDRGPFLLLGFTGHYIAPDGCYCLPGEKTIEVDGVEAITAGNDRDFRSPVSTAGLAQIVYGRRVRPPLMIQQPADCDYGDLHVEVHVHWGGDFNRSEVVERYFKFEVGGDLTPRAAARPPYILSDGLLTDMLACGEITQEEFDRAAFLTERDRYRIVRFPDYYRQVNPPTYGLWDVEPDYQEFLFDLHNRALARD